MIAKGIPHDNPAKLARYLVTPKEGERAELWELRGFASFSIVNAFRSVRVMAQGTKCRDIFFHVAVRNPESESLSRKQWEYAADRIERTLGLDGQPRAIAVHGSTSSGHQHMHVAWSRICTNSLKAKPVPFFKIRLKYVCRELEEHFGLTPVRNHRDSRIQYAPTNAEERQACRLGIDVHGTRETIRQCFENSKSGTTFQAALSRHGIILAQGDRRDYLVIDGSGAMHALGKRLLGIGAAEIRVRLADLVRSGLPTVDEARAAILGRQEIRPTIILGQQEEVIKPNPMPVQAPEVSVAISTAKTDRGITCTASTTKIDLGIQQMSDEPTPNSGGVCSAAKDDIPDPTSPPPAVRPGVQPQSGFSEILKREFRAVIRALTRRRGPVVQKERRGETTGSFRMVARRILQPISRVPLISQSTCLVNDALNWIYLWAWNTDAGGDQSQHNHVNLHEDSLHL